MFLGPKFLFLSFFFSFLRITIAIPYFANEGAKTKKKNRKIKNIWVELRKKWFVYIIESYMCVLCSLASSSYLYYWLI